MKHAFQLHLLIPDPEVLIYHVVLGLESKQILKSVHNTAVA